MRSPMSRAPDLETRRKRVRFRCWRRGSREADLLLGGFAERHLASLDEAQLARLEALLDQEDPDIWAWAVGSAPVPPEFDHDVMALLKSSAGRAGN